MSFISIVIVSVTFSECYISAREFMCLLLFWYFDVIWLFTLLQKKKIQCDILVYGSLFSFSFNIYEFFIWIFVLKWNSKFLGE